MPRITRVLWYCSLCKSCNYEFFRCSKCGQLYNQPNAQVAENQRAVVYYNPQTGEHRTPPRADMPIPPVYAAQGFERHEIMRMTDWEKSSGTVHEATNFHSGNELYSNDPVIKPPDPELVHQLAVDIADAAASGPWTGAEKFGI